MSNILLDTFQGTLGELISAHTIDTPGVVFTNTYGGDPFLDGSGRIKVNPDASGYGVYEISPPSADYGAELPVTFLDVQTDQQFNLASRIAVSGDRYALLYDGATNTLTLFCYVSSVATLVGSQVNFTPVANTVYTFRLEAVGTSFTVFNNGTSIISGTNDQLSAAGWVGYQMEGAVTNSTGIRFGAFRAYPLGTVVIPTNDAGLFFSPYNWYKNGSTSARTSTPGAYLNFKISGTTSVALGIDSSGQSGNSPNTAVIWSIDGGPVSSATLADNASSLSLATGMDSSLTHSVAFRLESNNAASGLWSGVPVTRLEITGIDLDSGGAVSLPDNLLSDSMMVFSDSIGIYNVDGGTKQCFSAIIPYGLACEFGVIGYGSQAWTNGGDGGVPALFTPGNDTASSWNKYYASLSRLSSGLFVPSPKYILISMGTNDFLGSKSGVNLACAGLLAALRIAAPGAKLILMVPWSQYELSALTSGFNTYQAAMPDSNCILVNSGAIAALGLNGGLTHPATFSSSDGVHPNMLAQALNSAITLRKIDTAFAGSGGGGINGTGILGMT